ncbi:ABC transporter ATP-binding protein [Candidatus Thorarchaeota archaeon]|nr:MAG: ABC transporter ATP-binding protein [Candidatus Thorarchaeota archaeon]
MKNILLLTQNVTKTYGDFVALSDISIDVRKAEIHSFLGPNGAGKTTLIKILATLLKKDSGSIQIAGVEIDRSENEVRQIIGYVGQDTERSAYARLTVRENLLFFAKIRGMSQSDAEDRIIELSEKFGLNEKIDCQFGHLSGGQKQSAVIIRALLHDPLLLFLDEPTKGLDPFAARKIRGYLKDYVSKRGRSIFLTSHILSEVEFLSDRVSLLHKGVVGITGNPEDLIESIGFPEMVCLRRSCLTPSVIKSILTRDHIIRSIELDDQWIGFGIDDTYEGMDSILSVLKTTGIKSEVQHRQVSLEDAFIHFIGHPGERFTVKEAA